MQLERGRRGPPPVAKQRILEVVGVDQAESGACKRSDQDISRVADKSKSYVKQCIRELEKDGLLQRETKRELLEGRWQETRILRLP